MSSGRGRRGPDDPREHPVGVAHPRLDLHDGRLVDRGRPEGGWGCLTARFTAAGLTTTGRCWRCGATATGSSRPLTATV